MSRTHFGKIKRKLNRFFRTACCPRVQMSSDAYSVTLQQYKHDHQVMSFTLRKRVGANVFGTGIFLCPGKK